MCREGDLVDLGGRLVRAILRNEFRVPVWHGVSDLVSSLW